MSSHKSIRIRASLINEYSNKLNRSEPFSGNGPYISVFKKGQFVLIFIAAKHVHGFANSTCRSIKKVFATRDFNHLIYEGELVNQGENVFAAKLAKHKEVSFSSGEPYEGEIKKFVLKKGYTLTDLRFFYGLRQIPQIILRGQKTENSIRSELKHFIKSMQLTPKQFEKLYEQRFGRKIKYKRVTTTMVGPLKDGPYWSNQMAHVIGRCREKAIAKNIQFQLNRKKKLLVIYGQGHLVQLRHALTEAMGKSKNYKNI